VCHPLPAAKTRLAISFPLLANTGHTAKSNTHQSSARGQTARESPQNSGRKGLWLLKNSLFAVFAAPVCIAYLRRPNRNLDKLGVLQAACLRGKEHYPSWY
jgi:hypothetical protein